MRPVTSCRAGDDWNVLCHLLVVGAGGLALSGLARWKGTQKPHALGHAAAADRYVILGLPLGPGQAAGICVPAVLRSHYSSAATAGMLDTTGIHRCYSSMPRVALTLQLEVHSEPHDSCATVHPWIFCCKSGRSAILLGVSPAVT